MGYISVVINRRYKQKGRKDRIFKFLFLCIVKKHICMAFILYWNYSRLGFFNKVFSSLRQALVAWPLDLFLSISLEFLCLFTGCRGNHQQTKHHINNLFTKESLKPERKPRQYLFVWFLQAGTLKSITLSSEHDCSTTSNHTSPKGLLKEISILQAC